MKVHARRKMAAKQHDKIGILHLDAPKMDFSKLGMFR